MSQPDIDVTPVIHLLDAGKTRVDELSEAEASALTARLGLGPDAIQDLFDERVARERTSPVPGGPAPDFNLELIDPQGARTGQMRRLFDHGDKPVALIFGSYT